MCSMLVAAACGSDEKPEETWLGTPQPESTTAASTAHATHPASPGGTAIVPEVAAGTTVLVMLNDNSLAVREQTIPPGPAVLTIENAGTQVHSLHIEGPGIQRAADDTIPAAGSGNLEVTFQRGTYTLYCPIADHRQKGEEITIQIQ